MTELEKELHDAAVDLLREFVPSRDRFTGEAQHKAFDAAYAAIVKARRGQ